MRPRALGRRSGPLVLGALVALLATLLVILPLARLGYVVWDEGAGRFDELWSRPGLGRSVANTIILAAVVTAVAVPAGALIALALRGDLVPARRAWPFAVLLPLLVPQFVLAYSWTQAYGRAGLTDTLLGLSWPPVQGAWGVSVVLVVNTLPLSYLVVAAGLAARAEPDLERAARASGSGAFGAFRAVTLPLLGPSLAAAAVLTFVLTLETFAIPQVLGTPGGFSTVTTTIYRDLAVASDPLAFVESVALALLLVILCLVVVLPADLWLGPRLRAERVSSGDGAAVRGRGRRVGRLTAGALGGYLVLGVGLPLVALLLAAVTPAVGVTPTPAHWTLDNFRAVVNDRTMAAFGRSLLLAMVAAGVLTGMGAAVAVLERYRRGRAAATVVTLTLVLPGSTLAVGMLITYGRWIGGTLTIILLAYLAKLWAFAHRPVSGALDRLPAAEMQAARASGAGPWTAVRTVALRALAPALLGGWLVCLTTSLHEVTMSSLLYGPDSDTLAVVVLNSEELGRIGQTAALSVLLTLVLVLPAWPAVALIRRLRGTGSRRTVREVADVPGS